MASEYRLKRGPVVVLLLVVAVVGAYVIGRGSTRPSIDEQRALTVPDARLGTTYAVDGLVCVRASSIGADITGVSARDSGAVTARLGTRPAGSPVTVGFPVPADAVGDVGRRSVAAGQEECLRLLLTPSAVGEQRSPVVSVRVRYGPLGLLRSTLDVRPEVVLQVTGPGPDPRTTA